MKKFKLIFKIIVTLPIFCFILPLAVYYEFEGNSCPVWLDRFGTKWGDFLKGEER